MTYFKEDVTEFADIQENEDAVPSEYPALD
jgi:hypothetical protein